MAVKRVQIIQKNLDLLTQRVVETDVRLAAERVKLSLQQILESETEGTGQLADSLQVQRGTQRGKPILRINSAEYGKFFFRGTEAPYAGIPPTAESAGRFEFWANRHAFRPRRLARIIALGKSRGKVYSDRTNLVIRALRNGFRS